MSVRRTGNGGGAYAEQLPLGHGLELLPPAGACLRH